LDKWTCNADGRQVAFWKTVAATKIHRQLHRSGLLLQCGRVELPRCSLAWGLRSKRCVR
jgi:hypothetical protein